MTIALESTVERHPTATPEQRALLEWDDANAIDRTRPDLTSNNRYQLPHPETGDDATWTRVTTFCEAIDDGSGLTRWKLGLTARGLALNDTLLAQAKTEHDNDKAIRAIAEDAHLWAGSKLAAAIGTALHTAVEHRAQGTGQRPPDPWGADVDAWATALDGAGITVLDGWLERIVVVPDLGCAGTLDQLVRLPDGRIVVLDLKTGKDVRKVNYAVQGAVYAHATHAWTPAGYEPLPDGLDTSIALIAHLPAGSGSCELIEVDAAAGWERALLCQQIRSARSIKGLFAAHVGGNLVADLEATAETLGDEANHQAAIAAFAAEPESENERRTVALTARLDAIRTAANPDHLDAVRRGVVEAGLPTKPPWSDADLTALAAILTTVDGQHETYLAERVADRLEEVADKAPTVDHERMAPCGDVPDDGDLVTVAEAEALRARAALHLTDETRQHAAAWTAECRRAGASLGAIVDRVPTRRRHNIDRAMLAAVVAFWADDPTEVDELTRAAITVVAPDLPVQATFTTGALLGALTIDEADRLAEVADAFAAGDKQTAVALAAVITNAA